MRNSLGNRICYWILSLRSSYCEVLKSIAAGVTACFDPFLPEGLEDNGSTESKSVNKSSLSEVGCLDQKEAGSEILQWTEPEAEEDTEDEWVKPSEFLKEKNKKTDKGSQPPAPKKQKKKSKSKKTRPPPVAPDEDDDESKGWASWKD